MDCKTFNDNINPFVKGTIEDDNIKEFIEHIKSCDNCKKELEIIYIAHKVFDDILEEESFNISETLSKYIKDKEEHIYKEHKRNFILNLLFYISELTSVAVGVLFVIERIIK